MKEVLLLFIVTAILVASASCRVRNTRDIELDNFNSIMERAKTSVSAKNFAQAETEYNEAAELAGEMKWTDGVVMAKRSLALSRLQRKDTGGAEVILTEAKELCVKSTDCSGAQLESLFNHLVQLYAFHTKEPWKVSKVVDDVVAEGARLSKTKPLAVILSSFVGYLNAAGFNVEADNLKARIELIDNDSRSNSHN